MLAYGGGKAAASGRGEHGAAEFVLACAVCIEPKMSDRHPTHSDFRSTQFTPGKAYWNQRAALARSRERILTLSRTVGRASDLSSFQFAQLLACALEYGPDLIVELGRYMGNSTCAFTEAANQLPAAAGCRVLSLCNTRRWDWVTAPKLRKILPRSWFDPLEARRADILKFDFSKALANSRRVLLFWDAHGFDIAECVLGAILPQLAGRDHLVLMHDLSDIRYSGGSSDYNGKGLWKGINAGETRFRIGIIDSAVAQGISIQDFAGRNRLTLDSADHSIDLEILQVPGRAEEMRSTLGEELFSTQAHWFWFTLNEHPGPFTFPRYRR